MISQRPYIIVAIVLVAIILAAALYAGRVYVPPQPPPEMIWTIKGQVLLHHQVAPGDLITAPNLGTIYYVNSNRERLTFPDEVTFLSWYEDFSAVKTVPRELLESFSLAGRNVTVRPGTHLLKIPTSPQVWMIGHPNILFWLQGGEEQVAELFGGDWATRLIDLPEYFFSDYQEGSALTGTQTYPTGLVFFASNNQQYYLAAGNGLRLVTEAGLRANRWQQRFIISVDTLPDFQQSGPPVTSYEPFFSSPDQQEQKADVGPVDIDIQGAELEVG